MDATELVDRFNKWNPDTQMTADMELAHNARMAALEQAALLAEEVGQSTGDGEGEHYIARKIADAIRKLKS